MCCSAVPRSRREADAGEALDDEVVRGGGAGGAAVGAEGVAAAGPDEVGAPHVGEAEVATLMGEERGAFRREALQVRGGAGGDAGAAGGEVEERELAPGPRERLGAGGSD